MTQTGKVNGAEALLELFRTLGTDYIFCSPIAAWAPLWEALARRQATTNIETPKYLNCRHEILAVGLASGYYKATGRTQAVLLPTGLGVLHGALALRSAYHEHIPMVVVAPDTLTHGAVPGLDPGPEWPTLLVDLAGPVRNSETVTKWGKEVKTGGDLAPDVRRAWYFAESVPRGPTLLSVPFDILMSEVDELHGDKAMASPLVAPIDSLRDVADLLMRSRAPLIVTEHAARTPQDQAALVAIAEHTGAPVFEYWMPMYVNFPRAHPLYATDPIEAHLADADCILVVGAHGPWHPQETKLPEDCSVIQIEEDPLRPRAPYWGFRTDYCVAGDVGSNLAQLAALLTARTTSAEEAGRVAARTARWQAHNGSNQAEAAKEREAVRSGGRIHAALLFDTLHRMLPDRSVIVDEIVAQVPAMIRHLFRERDFSHVRGWAGALGTGMPTALGVKLARPRDMVVCVIGDGAFSYNPVPACLGLAQQYGVPILVVICNNQGYVSQEWNLYKYFPSGYALRDNNPYGRVIEPTPDYSAMAPAFGAHGECVTDPGQLESAIQRAIAVVEQGQLALLDLYGSSREADVADVLLRPGHTSLADWRAIYRGGAVTLDPACHTAIAAAAHAVDAILAKGEPVYGINTGFGRLASIRIAPADLATLQRNIVLSHAAGVGEPMPASMVRLMLSLKLASLAQGASGVRFETVQFLSAMLTNDLLPVVPTQGSVGASGDLSHPLPTWLPQ